MRQVDRLSQPKDLNKFLENYEKNNSFNQKNQLDRKIRKSHFNLDKELLSENLPDQSKYNQERLLNIGVRNVEFFTKEHKKYFLNININLNINIQVMSRVKKFKKK